jgi:predicted ATP-dependent protease
MSRELNAEQLRRRAPLDHLPYTSTADAPELDEIIGQERATRAIEFGIDIPYYGYNMFAMGPVGTGKTSTITRFLQHKARTRAVPPDWGYVHNFSDPDRPRALRLPPGGGARLRDQVNQLLEQMADALLKAFASDVYAERRHRIEREVEQQQHERLRELERTAREQGFGLLESDNGLIMTPLHDGEPLTPEQFMGLPDDEQHALTEKEAELQEALERTLRQVQEFAEDAQLRLAHVDMELAAATIEPLFVRLVQEYQDWPDVTAYLQSAAENIATHTGELRKKSNDENGEENGDTYGVPKWLRPSVASFYDRYRLNVIVDNQGLAGAPVVLETNPTYSNLVGRVELRAELGTLVTDYRHIKAGALHKANGGYLVLDARILLEQPLAWEALKQALRNERVRIEEMSQQVGVLATTTLSPEPIPLQVKVVLIGDPQTYYLLYEMDEQFEKLFKVRADFAGEMVWNAENERKIAQFIRARSLESELPHFDLGAVSRVVEYSGRLVEDQRKLTTQFALISDIVYEAAFWAQRRNAQASQVALVTADDVERAIAERTYRSNLIEERLREMIADGTIMIDTTGAAVGQVNGLAVLELGDYAFGKPGRVTVRTHLGRAGVINIEREARLSGSLHDKGVLILGGFLGGRFAQARPLSLSATVAFEQSYDLVDGDSASSTELYALLSSLANLPIRQDTAVTGSVNQHGDIQAIGGATLKIEGFFDVCRVMPGGLTGTQGVIVPASNVPNLMLRADIVDAVAAGQFHIYPVRTVDEGIEILTGVPAGAPDASGTYPADSVNGRVDAALQRMADHLRPFIPFV